MLITSCAPVTTLPVPTATAYVPVSQNTPIPLAYEKITPETSHLLTLLTRWEFSTQVDGLGFTPSHDMLCMGEHEVAQSWDLFMGRVNPVSTDCHIPFPDYSFGRAISSDGHYSAETRSGSLMVVNLLKPSTYLYYYLDNAVSVGFSSNGGYITIAFQNGQVWFVPKSKWEDRLINLEDESFYGDTNLRPELIIDVKKPPQQIFFSPSDTLIAFLFEDQTIQLWNVSDLSLYSTINSGIYPTPQATVQPFEDKIYNEENQGPIYKIVFSPDDRILITASVDNYIRLWDTQTGKFLVALEGCQDNAEATALLFSPTKRLLASLYGGYWVCVWGILPDNLDEAKLSATAISESVFPAVSPVSSFPKPTSTPKSALPDYQSQIPLSWPVSMPTNQQIIEARKCSIEALAESRYHEEMNYWELENAHPLNSACDWAVLAVAYRSHFDDKDSIPEEGKRAFFEAVRENPAFAMSTSLFYSYFNSLQLVEIPLQVNQPIKSMVIDYSWSGIGEPSQVEYHIEIDNVHLASDQVELTVKSEPENLKDNMTSSFNVEKIQGIGKALTDFLPIESSFTLENCTDNSPDWNIDLTLLDGTQLTLKTHASNFFTAGGPWYMELDNQSYVQFSSALLSAVLGLFDSLNLPLGQPYSTFCSQVDTFELAYP